VRYKVGAEQVEQVPPLAHRPDETVRSARTTPVGPTHAVDTATGAAACGINTDALDVLDQDWRKRSSSSSALAVSPRSSPKAWQELAGKGSRWSDRPP
jgi:hypothetical protein